MEQKRGEGKQKILKRGQAGSGGGSLKKGGLNPLINYACTNAYKYLLINRSMVTKKANTGS